MDSAQLKRMILEQAESSGIRKKYVSGESHINSGDIIEMGEALEALTKMKGWNYVEVYSMKAIDPIGNIMGDSDAEKKGTSKGFIMFLQWVEQTIQAKNELLRKEREAKDAQRTKPTEQTN